MTNSFLNTQNGGKKSKERKITGVRYLSNSDIFLKSNNKFDDLPDSLDSFSDDSVKSKSDRYKFSEESSVKSSVKSNMRIPANNMYPNMGMPANNMYPNMAMPANSMYPNMAMPANGMYPNVAMDMNQMGMAPNMSNKNITNNDLVKLGIMAPSMTSSLLKTSQMGGAKDAKSNEDEYININGNFFF